jgi:hypothetical protein
MLLFSNEFDIHKYTISYANSNDGIFVLVGCIKPERLVGRESPKLINLPAKKEIQRTCKEFF